MTVAVFFGCTFIAFGPAVSLFLFTIARDPLRVIFLIAGYVSRQKPGHEGLQVQSGLGTTLHICILDEIYVIEMLHISYPQRKLTEL